MNHAQRIADHLNIGSKQVSATIQLLDDGNTVPFISRYRKEVTGGLDEEQIREIGSLVESQRALEKRRQTILDTVTEQGNLTPELRQKLQLAETMTALEDLYQPYKPKRRTRASVAKERGLQPLADLIIAQSKEPKNARSLAQTFLNEEVPTTEEALAGARDIVAETISDKAEVRQQTREKGLVWGMLVCRKIDKAEDPRAVYKTYYEFQGRADRLQPHQVLAINRGEKEKILRVSLEVPERDWRRVIENYFRPDRRSVLAEQLQLAIDDAAGRLLLPAIERDIRRELTKKAEGHAITVFAVNLRNLLLQPPLTGYNVLGLDPGYRTGCKVAVVDGTGKVVDSGTIYPHPPQKKRDQSLRILRQLVDGHQVGLIAIGNGTASRETEGLVADLISSMDGSENGQDLQYLITNEAGASVYSASPLARAELPEFDVTIRGAVSIARRVQDPLSELVKIDPRSIGVGLYQHDVNQNELSSSLDGVVEGVVNRVGVEVNTASIALLTHVSGIGPKLAGNIVAYRDQNGPFPTREDLRQVSGMGPRSFEQAAGFLRINDGPYPLDASAIHPESYVVAEAVLEASGLSTEVPPAEREPALRRWQDEAQRTRLAAELGTGLPTLNDILEQLVRPGRDPRAEFPPPILRTDVLNMDDLQPGMHLKGTVRNVVDFGAFVDVGVKNDGLLHRSQWPRNSQFGVGDVIDVKILKVEADRGRISLGWVD